jgi:hypothetical protein
MIDSLAFSGLFKKNKVDSPIQPEKLKAKEII